MTNSIIYYFSSVQLCGNNFGNPTVSFLFFIFGNREILFLVVDFWHLNEWCLDQGLLWTHSHVSRFFTAETQFRLSGSWYRALEVAYGLIKVDRKHAESRFLCQNFSDFGLDTAGDELDIVICSWWFINRNLC